MRDRLRRFRLHLLAAALFAGLVVYAVTSSAAPVVPVPDAIVMVHTESGGVVRDTPVPIGGAPIPIDVDNGSLLGILSPDIDVSVGLVAVDELPSNILVPNIVVKRDALALLRTTPAPPLKINARIIINDVGNLKRLATVDYGFETPAGAVIPPVVTAKLVGPPTSGFVDPLKAKIETPGYSGPLKFNIKAVTDTFEGTFGLKFDPLPEKIAVNMDPRDDGLDFTYDHSGPTPDVKLDASMDLKDVPSSRVRHIGASVERLPNHIQLSNTNTNDKTFFDYQSGSDLGKPDLQAEYRDTLADGTIVSDVNAKVSGLPSHMQGTINTRPGANGTTDVDGVKFDVLEGGQIDAVDFLARNFVGDPATVPEYNLGPDQFVSVVTRRQPDGTSRFRAAGRLESIRGGEFKRVGPNHDKLDITTNVGDGTKPLRAILDTDNRGAPAADSPKFMKVDATVTPLPQNIHVFFEPNVGTDPMHLVYDASSTVDIDADATIAKGPTEGCGQDRVMCATARVDKVPSHMDIKLPGQGGTDFSISHNGGATQRPDVRAIADVGPDLTAVPPSKRTWVKAALLRIPNEVRGRLDTNGGELRAAEFHGCSFDYAANACTDTQGAIGRVAFTVRDQPSRSGLPPRPDTADQYVTLIGRHQGRFEVQGRVDEVRNVVFHQLDRTPGDGKTDGVLGALVDVGAGGQPFDLVVDDLADAFNESTNPPTLIGEKKSDIAVNVATLPRKFSACVRSTKEVAPPAPGDLPNDPLLAPCETTNVVNPDTGEHVVTPLSANYTAQDANGNPQPTKVTAHVKSTSPNLGDLDASNAPIPSTDVLDLTIDKVPASLRADVIPPITPDPTAVPPVTGRKLQLVYDASSKIDTIDFGLESRRASSICEDPRPNRKALCVGGTLKNLPKKVTASYNPDDSKGDIDFKTDPPASGDPRMSILPFHLSKVSADPTSKPLVLDATIEDISDHLTGKIQSMELSGEDPPGTPTIGQQLATCSDGIDNNGDGKIDAADPACGKDPARLSFNACPDGACSGIGKITFKATNALVGDPIPNVPAASPPVPGLDQEFSFMQIGEDFRAKGVVRNLKELSYSKLDASGAPSRVTSLRAAFGNGSPLRAYIDRDTGKETQKVDGIITDAPQAITICLRDKTNMLDLKPGSTDFCERTDANGDGRTDEDKLALQARLDTAASGTLPDIELRKFEMSKGGGAEFLTGKVTIEDLAQRIDALVGKGNDTEVLVEGHNIGDAPGATPQNVAKRVSFYFRNFRDASNLNGFPWTPLDGGADPKFDSANNDAADGNRKNFLQLFKNKDGHLTAEGSVPEIKRIQLEPRPCNNDGSRFPTTGFAATQKPDYKCIHATVAPGRPLGLAVRTLDEKDEILSVEEGHISKMPDSLTATIAKAPDSIKLFPLCDATHPAPCRPPMISVEAPHTGPAGTLDARMAIGPTDLQKDLRNAGPDDPLSARLNYEERPALPSFPNGARVKVGTDEASGGLALRLGVKVDIPRFLDLDPPTLYDCKHETQTPGGSCTASGVGKEFNHGYESKDIAFRLVAADDKHYGNPAASNKYLGRVALMVEPFKQTDKTQIVLTGMPSPDDKDPLTKRSTLGASSKFAEDFPTLGDPSEKGFLAPAHLDAQVFLRNDYNAVKDGRDQVAYSQIDGRVNAPLSLAIRLNDRPPSDPNKLKKYVSPLNRAGTKVTPTQLTVRNAPSSNNTDDYANPTFRVKAELRDKFKEDKNPDLVDKIFTCDGQGYGIQIPALLTFCALLPVNAQNRYIDVQLNSDPRSDGSTTTSGAARDIEAVAGPFGSKNDADLKGFKNFDGSGGAANITPVAALRLTNFNLGLKIGGGIGLVGGSTTYEMVGDLLLGLAGHAVDRTRISSNLAGMELTSEGGTDPNDFSRVITDLEAQMHFKVTAEFLFGLASADIIDASTPKFHQPIVFKSCSLTGFLGIELPSQDEFWSGQGNNFLFADAQPGSRKGTIGFGVPASFAGQANQFNIMLSKFLQPLWCAFSTSSASMGTPTAGYVNNDRLVPGQSSTSNPSSTTPPAQPPAIPDLTVNSPVTLCGQYTYNDITITDDVTVANSGTDANGHTCDGSINLIGRKVTITGPGDIIADGKRTQNGSGFPGSGFGGGAGHHGNGGQSGRNRAFSGQGPGGSPYNAPAPNAGGSLADFGSRGRDGTGTGGQGAGTIRISASDRIIDDGQIRANGAGGTAATINTGGSCITGGGGGSGGAVELSANIVDGSGTVEVMGGNGGDGGFGGGGGSGGRVTMNTVVDNISHLTGGGTGASQDSGYCDPGPNTAARKKGDNGDNGTAAQGVHLNVAANADLNGATPGPFTNQDPKVDVVGIDQNAGPLEIVLCHRSLGWGSTSPFSDPALDPSGNGNVSQLVTGATCGDVVGFSAPNSGSWEYKHTFTVGLGSSVYGFFAYARQPYCPTGGTYSPGSRTCFGGSPLIYTPSYVDQDHLPSKASARIGVDKGDPSASPIQAINGTPGCPNGAFCLTEKTGTIDVTAQDSESGVVAVECRVNTPTTTGSFGDCRARPTTLALPAEGENSVDVRVTDQAGNSHTYTAAVTWFVDTVKPNKPVVVVVNVGSAKNGWYSTKPNVSVFASDPNPSSGFTNTPISLFVDDGEFACGSAQAGSSSTSGATATNCAAGDTASAIPDDGVHSFTATVKDRLGNKSDTADSKSMKVDTTRPSSRFFIGPKNPDGSAGWYRTKPFVAFAASDSAAGSGVNPALDVDGVGAGIHYSIDGAPFQVFNPAAPNELSDGVHSVCFYAVDLAGNREDADPTTAGLQDNCVSNIKVDVTAPVAGDPISPAAPNGNNSYYLSKPTITPGATDGGSGVAKVQYQVDDGAWTTAAPFQADEGEHDIRVRAFDVAGNPADLRERTVRVDLHAPTGKIGSYPPNANGQGWFRQNRINAVSVRDQRDGSGADGATYTIDAGGPISYLTPFAIEPGVHTAKVTPRDRAGLLGPAIVQKSNVDVTRPVATPSPQQASPILITLLGIFGSTALKYTVTDDLAPRVKVSVFVFDELGTLVRRLPVTGPYAGGFSAVGGGQVVWNGRNEENKGVLPGVYHFRVQAIDQAGNSVLSTESKGFLVIQGLLPF